MSEVPKNTQDLREMVYHTDARVTAMEGQITTIGHNQLRSEQKLDQLISSINTPKQVNYAAWVGVGLTTLAMVLAGAFGLGSYISLVNEPQMIDIANNNEAIDDLGVWQHQSHYEFGVIHNNQAHVADEISRLWDHIHKLEDRDSELEKQAAAAEVSRKAMGDFMKDVDQYGSRRWMGDRE